ncbi:hypothetical protein D3C78_1527830 [compost metagenome]
MQLGRQVDVEFRPGGHGRHHRLEPQQPGHAQPAQGAAVFAGQLLGGLVGLVGVGGVADLAQLGEQARERQLLVMPVQQQAVVGQVQARLGDAGQVAQVLFDQPAAGGAADAFDQQGGFGQVASMANEGLLYVAAVVEGQFVL